MTPAEIRKFEVELLDDIHELASEPVGGTEKIRKKVEAFFSTSEGEADGEKTRKTTTSR